MGPIWADWSKWNRFVFGYFVQIQNSNQNKYVKFQKLISLNTLSNLEFHSSMFSSMQFSFVLQNTQIYEDLLTFKWHHLPENYKKHYQILLHHVQQPYTIYVAGVMQLNLETCVSVSMI